LYLKPSQSQSGLGARAGFTRLVSNFSSLLLFDTGQAAFAFALSMRIRRGFLSDTAHDDVMQFLSASGVFERAESHVVSGPNSSNLEKVTALIRDMDLFERERSAIEALRAIKLTANMLEGW
jgi:hypothetical protein